MNRSTIQPILKKGQKENQWVFITKKISTSLQSRILIFSTLLLLTLSSCGQSSLYKRWQLAGRFVKGKKDMNKTGAQEYEFFSNGKFNHYANGSIVHTGSYTLASDKKSLLLKDGNRDVPMKIIKLTSDELNLQLGNDTVICYPSTSASGTKAKQTGAAYQTARLDWFMMRGAYESYNTIGTVALFGITQQENKKESELEKNYTMLLGQAEPYTNRAELGSLTKEEFASFQAIEDKISKALAEIATCIKEKHPNMVSYSGSEKIPYYVYFENMIASSEKYLNTTKTKFTKSFGEYTK